MRSGHTSDSLASQYHQCTNIWNICSFIKLRFIKLQPVLQNVSIFWLYYFWCYKIRTFLNRNRDYHELYVLIFWYQFQISCYNCIHIVSTLLLLWLSENKNFFCYLREMQFKQSRNVTWFWSRIGIRKISLSYRKFVT